MTWFLKVENDYGGTTTCFKKWKTTIMAQWFGFKSGKWLRCHYDLFLKVETTMVVQWLCFKKWKTTMVAQWLSFKMWNPMITLWVQIVITSYYMVSSSWLKIQLYKRINDLTYSIFLINAMQCHSLCLLNSLCIDQTHATHVCISWP